MTLSPYVWPVLACNPFGQRPLFPLTFCATLKFVLMGGLCADPAAVTGGMMDMAMMGMPMGGPMIIPPGAAPFMPMPIMPGMPMPFMAPGMMMGAAGARGRGARGAMGGMMRGRGGRFGALHMAGPGAKLDPAGIREYYDLDNPQNNRAVLDYGDL